jgi:hypothetical protein
MKLTTNQIKLYANLHQHIKNKLNIKHKEAVVYAGFLIKEMRTKFPYTSFDESISLAITRFLQNTHSFIIEI